MENVAKHTELKSTEIPRENVPKMATVVYKEIQELYILY